MQGQWAHKPPRAGDAPRSVLEDDGETGVFDVAGRLGPGDGEDITTGPLKPGSGTGSAPGIPGSGVAAPSPSVATGEAAPCDSGDAPAAEPAATAAARELAARVAEQRAQEADKQRRFQRRVKARVRHASRVQTASARAEEEIQHSRAARATSSCLSPDRPGRSSRARPATAKAKPTYRSRPRPQRRAQQAPKVVKAQRPKSAGAGAARPSKEQSAPRVVAHMRPRPLVAGEPVVKRTGGGILVAQRASATNSARAALAGRTRPLTALARAQQEEQQQQGLQNHPFVRSQSQAGRPASATTTPAPAPAPGDDGDGGVRLRTAVRDEAMRQERERVRQATEARKQRMQRARARDAEARAAQKRAVEEDAARQRALCALREKQEAEAKEEEQARVEARKRERASQAESASQRRYVQALHQRVAERVASMNVVIPPLCQCPSASVPPGHIPNVDMWKSCAVNCPFYKSPHKFARALGDLLSSLSLPADAGRATQRLPSS